MCVCVCACVRACVRACVICIVPSSTSSPSLPSPSPSPSLPHDEGGINDLVVDMIKCCREQGIPLICAMTRQHLGKLMRKKVPVSAVGIFSYDGAEVGALPGKSEGVGPVFAAGGLMDLHAYVLCRRVSEPLCELSFLSWW